MAKKLRICDRLLLGLALMGDVLDETIGSGAHDYLASSQSIKTMMPPEYKAANFYHAVWRTLRAGEIEKVIKNGKPFLRITGVGEKKLARDFSLLKTRKKRWDWRWCLVIFDIEEKRKSLRNSLRRKLEELGFGNLQRSVYLSPYDFSDDLVEYFEEEKILGQVFVLVCKHRLMGDPKQLASSIWPLEELNEKYGQILEKLKEAKTSQETSLHQEAMDEFFELTLGDPFLPKELLPENWHGDEVFKLLNL